jgi:5-methylcytosine-specific restriction endonuclease McrA
MSYLGIKKEKTLLEVFEAASDLLYEKPFIRKNGITSRMILYLCKEKNISCLGFDQRDRVFVKHAADKAKGRKYPVIIFYMCMSHFYLITDKEAILSLSATFRQGNNKFHSSLDIDNEIKQVEKTYYSNLSVKECLKLPENSVVIYDKHDLMEELRDYIKLTNDLPKIKSQSITTIGKISIPIPNSKKKNHLVISGCFTEGLNWEKVQDICIKNEIIFNNQSFGTLLAQIRDKRFKTSREKFTKSQRETIKTKQNGKCNKCKEEIKNTFHIDHIQPLSNNGTNEPENLQALCVSCHIEKTKEEKQGIEQVQTDNLMSSFNMQAMEAIKSDWFRKVAFTQYIIDKDENEKYKNMVSYKKTEPASNVTFDQNLDDKMNKFTVKCIDNNKNRKNILVHSGHDFPRYSVLDDIELFDGNITTGFYYIESENTFPLRKNGFYSEPMVKFCLNKNIINKSQIKYQFKSSFKIKTDYFATFVEHLYTVFAADEKMKKLSVNSLIGLFGRRKHSFVENRLCDKNETDDVACAYQDFLHPYIIKVDENTAMVTGKSDIKSIESYFPLHAQILDIEAMELYMLTEKIKNGGGIPYAVKTDAVLYYDDGETKINIDNDFWDKDETLTKYKFEENVKDICREVLVSNESKFVLPETVYNKVEEMDDFTEIAKMIIQMNKGMWINAPAGCGKTYLVNILIKLLEERNIRKLATTNKAALLINGETLDKFTYGILNNTITVKQLSNIEYIFAEECSMMREIFYQVLLMLKHYNPDLKLIVVGDFGQLPPVNDRVNKNYEKSRALFELVDGNKLGLTKCRRSDDALFNICQTVRNGGNIDLKQFAGNEPTYLNVCFTNKMRKEINEFYMERFVKEYKPKKVVNFKALVYDKNTQDFTLCKGMPVIARINQKSLDVVNNELFTVSYVTDETITLKNEMKEKIKIPTNKFEKIFGLAFCLTIHKSQGATFDEKYTIWEWEKLSTKLKYVAISRATEMKNIIIK